MEAVMMSTQDELRDALDTIAGLRERVRELEAAGKEVLGWGRSYMDYHAGKFYDGLPRPVGMTPALDAFEAVLSEVREKP
jgi:hypothetical protein